MVSLEGRDKINIKNLDLKIENIFKKREAVS